MKNLLAAVILLFIAVSCCSDQSKVTKQEKKINFGLVIHGGAGSVEPGWFTPEEEKAHEDKLKEAINAGYAVLENGGTAVEAVEKTINVLENSPMFNAGKGAVFTNAGTNELDASIMDGKTKNSGAVAGVTNVKNPISLARKVMEESPHVMFAREGAELFAEKFEDIEKVDPEYFYTEARYNSLRRALEREKNNDQSSLVMVDYKFGTVGCAAMDKEGNLAAGTSTGGMTNKKWGRVGDSPIIGAGTYADNNTCAISATGHGEYFIRSVVAYDIAALMDYKGMDFTEAADYVVNDKLVKFGGDGGIIGMDKYGNIAMPFNTKGMFRGYRTDKDEIVVKMYTEEDADKMKK